MERKDKASLAMSQKWLERFQGLAAEKELTLLQIRQALQEVLRTLDLWYMALDNAPVTAIEIKKLRKQIEDLL